jgi:hypothetical protein
MPITIGNVIKGPMPTMSIMLIAVACARLRRLANEVSAINSYACAYSGAITKITFIVKGQNLDGQAFVTSWLKYAGVITLRRYLKTGLCYRCR